MNNARMPFRRAASMALAAAVASSAPAALVAFAPQVALADAASDAAAATEGANLVTALKATGDTGGRQLIGNASIVEDVNVVGGKTIELNGKTLTLGNYDITVPNGVTLYIKGPGTIDASGAGVITVETGGSLIRLKYRHKRARKRHLVLLCDVSGSMIQFSEFALRFIKSLSDVAESSRTFIFSEDMVEVDPFALQNMDMFVQYVRTTGLYGKGTDLGSALAKLCALRPAALGASTTLLILSDAKTVKLEDAQAAMITANQMAGDVVWLNPIPQRKWKHLRSVQTMELLCRMVPCSTLSELARECRKLVLS